jgi:hypothetical protein
MTTAGPALVAGRYRLGESLGAGGMGRVWLARDTILDRDVAIKEIVRTDDLAGAEDGAAQRRTLREARAAARLSHPSVAQVYDVFQVDGRTWIVMEHVPSRSLQQAIDADGPMAPARVAGIGLQVLAALDAAHRAGVTHRDVKPANVLLAGDGRVVLTDFGIATIEGDGITTTGSDQVFGSPQYMAPERARHGAKLPASDLWSLGATLYAAVEGRPPYQRPSAVGTLTAIAADEPDPAVRAGALRPVLDGLLRKDPATRIGVAEAGRLLRAATEEIRPGSEAAAETVVMPVTVSPAAPERPAAEPAAVREPTVRGPTVPEPVPAPAVRRAWRERLRSRGRRASRGGRAWRGPRPLLVAVVVLLVAGLAAWLALRSGGTGGRTSATAPSAAAPAAAGPSPTRPTSGLPSASTGANAAVTPTRPPLPAGWRNYRDKTGFSLYVPTGWTRSQDGSIVYFRDPRTGRVLGIDQTDAPRWNPVADWRGKASYRVQHGDFPGYDEIHIAEVKYFRKAADWEYTFDGRVRLHVNNRGFVVSAHQAYGIYWQTSDAGWAAARPDLQLIFDSFRPA